jgi:hypothetical protein
VSIVVSPGGDVFATAVELSSGSIGHARIARRLLMANPARDQYEAFVRGLKIK